MAGASVDYIFVIVLFTTFTSLAIGAKASISSFSQIPISIILGVLVGSLLGAGFIILFKKFHIRDTIKIIIIISYG